MFIYNIYILYMYIYKSMYIKILEHDWHWSIWILVNGWSIFAILIVNIKIAFFKIKIQSIVT